MVVKQTGRVAPAMASVDQPQCGLLGESGDIGQPLGSRGEFCLPSSSSPSQSLEAEEKGLFWTDKNLGQPLGRGEFCLPYSSSPSQSLEVEEKGLFWTDKNLGQPLGRGEFCLPCTSLAPALLGRTLSRRLPSGDVLQAEVTPVHQIYPGI